MATRKRKQLLGIDVGASGIKGAIVDLETGKFVNERIKLLTPKPATPLAVAKTIRTLASHHQWKKGDVVGCGFPAVVVRGKTTSAANIDDAWLNLKAEKYLSAKTGYEIHLINDADAAGIAELRFGNVRDQTGTVVLLTLGTGIGSTVFVDGVLVPNTEFGHMPYKRSIAEDYVSNRARKERKLSIDRWAHDLNEYLEHINRMLTPDLIILGGGISKKFASYEKHLDPGVPIVPARLYNDAGIVGAAMYANRNLK